MEAIAKTKYLKGSPRKARLVIDLVRGKNVSQALAILKFTNKRAAEPIAKCLRSAIANATYKAEQENIAIDPDDLWIKTCFVDMGPTKNRRRLRPAPQGRAFFERRHFCHITIEVTSEPQEEKEEPAGKKAKAKKGAPKKAESKAAKPPAKKAKAEKPAKKAEAPKKAKEDKKADEQPKAEKKEAKAEPKAKKADAAETEAKAKAPKKESKPEPAKKPAAKKADKAKDDKKASSEEE